MPILGILASSTPAAAGDYESIATVTVGSGGASSVTFSSIGTDWTHLQLRYLSADERASSVDSPLYLRFNSDTSSSYSFHELMGDGSITAGYAASSQTLIWLYGGGALAFGVGVADILNYKNTNMYKTVRTLTGDDNNGSGLVRLNSALWQKTNAIDTITLTPFSGNFRQYSHFALYGIKSA